MNAWSVVQKNPQKVNDQNKTKQKIAVTLWCFHYLVIDNQQTRNHAGTSPPTPSCVFFTIQATPPTELHHAKLCISNMHTSQHFEFIFKQEQPFKGKIIRRCVTCCYYGHLAGELGRWDIDWLWVNVKYAISVFDFLFFSDLQYIIYLKRDINNMKEKRARSILKVPEHVIGKVIDEEIYWWVCDRVDSLSRQLHRLTRCCRSKWRRRNKLCRNTKSKVRKRRKFQ